MTYIRPETRREVTLCRQAWLVGYVDGNGTVGYDAATEAYAREKYPMPTRSVTQPRVLHAGGFAFRIMNGVLQSNAEPFDKWVTYGSQLHGRINPLQQSPEILRAIADLIETPLETLEVEIL